MRIENSRQLTSFAMQIKQETQRKNQFDVSVFVDDLQHGYGSLLLQINPSGTMTFRYLHRCKGKREFIHVGAYSDTDTGITLLNAQSKARELNHLCMKLGKGVSVKNYLIQQEIKAKIEAEKCQKLGSISELIDDYTAAMKHNNKRTFKQVKQQLQNNLKGYLNLNAGEVSSSDISRILARIIDRKAFVQANRVRSYMHAMFSFGMRFDNDPLYLSRNKKYEISTNPVACVPRQIYAENVRDRVLKSYELSDLFIACKSNCFSLKIGLLIRLLFLLGGQRPNEILASKWEHFDLENSLWNLPGSITKNKKEHIIPIPEKAQQVLRELQRITGVSDYLFPQKNILKPMTSPALNQAIRKYCDDNEVEPFQPRDIRRTVKTKMGELGISKQIRDRIQNHIMNDISSKHYDRYDYLIEKKEALIVWETRLKKSGI